MNIVIPMAGHSRRFKAAGYAQPKFMIDINGSPMISRVVDMFDPDDRFHFIVNDDQVRNEPNLGSYLRSLAAKSSVTIIPSHEGGPVFSALQLKNIDPKEECILTYCDFSVDWSYQVFLNKAREGEASLAVFRGFHPASYGNTLYAYIRNEGNRFLEIQEKKSFTSNRTEEYASVGIHYFKTWDLFAEYAQELVLQCQKNKTEAYASLLFNLLQRDGHLTTLYEVSRFICWGTPEDLERYLFWSTYFLGKSSELRNETAPKGSVNLLPMAGTGNRFKEYGYRVTKPLIQVDKKPMVITAAQSLPSSEKWIYILQEEQLQKHPIARALTSHHPDCDIIPVKGQTSGQAATCLLAEKKIGGENELLIASCDYKTLFNPSAWESLKADPSVTGAIWTFRMGPHLFKNPKAFAYCKLKPGTHEVAEIIEKQTISPNPENDPMVIGTFWFRHAKDFFAAAKNMISMDIRVNGEHYVGTSINYLLSKGKKFLIFDVNQWISFGDPFELQVLEYWEDHFQTLRDRNPAPFD